MLNAPDTPGAITIDAIRPLLSRWMGRKSGNLSYHMTQILTDHGCIGHYLHRMQKRPSPECQHCEALDDTVVHIMEDCPAWTEQRAILRRELELMGANDLTLHILQHSGQSVEILYPLGLPAAVRHFGDSQQGGGRETAGSGAYTVPLPRSGCS